MAEDPLRQLAQLEVPPLPEDFDRQLHQKINHGLLLTHLFDLLIRGLPFAVMCFSQAFMGLVMYSLSGRYSRPQNRGHERDAEDRSEEA